MSKAKKITEEKVKALKVRPQRYVGAAEDGLIVEVFPTGRKSFYAKYRDGGKQVKEKLGEYPAISVRQAREMVLDLQHKLKIEQAPVAQSAITFRDFVHGPFKDWAKANRKKGAETVQRLDLLFVPKFGKKKLRDVTTEDVIRWLNEAQGRLEAATIVRDLGDLRRAFNLAVEWGYLRKSPADAVKNPRVDKAKAKLYLSDDEFKQLQDGLGRWDYLSFFGTPLERRYHPSWLPLYVRILVNTGLRRNEALRLRWCDIEDVPGGGGRVVAVRGTHSKNATTRRVPISPELERRLLAYNVHRYGGTDASGEDQYAGGDDPIFPVRDAKKAWDRLRTVTGLGRRLHPHLLRHHFCTTLVRNGARLHVVKELAGHSSITVTERYLSARREDHFEAMNLL